MFRNARIVPVIAMLVISAIAAPIFASKATFYASTTFNVSGVVPPRVELAAGADSGASDHVVGFALSSNRTKFSAELRGYGGATTVVTALFNIRNVDSVSRGVVLTGTQVTNAAVTTLTFEVFDGAVSKGVLNLKGGSPTLDLGSMPAGKTYSVKMELKLAVGAGTNTVDQAITISLWRTP